MNQPTNTRWFDRLVSPPSTATEADIQANIHGYVLTAPLGLRPDQVDTVGLEVQAGQGKRIDVQVGQCVIEVKRSLSSPTLRAAAENQLAGYLELRAQEGSRYTGLLTDGITWRLYTLAGQKLHFIEEVDAKKVGRESFTGWLSAVLATKGQQAPTKDAIIHYLGAESPAHRMDFTTLKALWEDNHDNTELATKKELWGKLLVTALGENVDQSTGMFLEHTYLVVIADLIAHHLLGLETLRQSAKSILSGEQFSAAGIYGVVEDDFFAWLAQVKGGSELVQSISRRLASFDWTQVSGDVLKILYESIIDAEQRKRLGEYYTPDWLAEAVLEHVVDDPGAQTLLDPACGSGTFLLHSVRRALAAYDKQGLTNAEALDKLTRSVYGIDVHPVAVALARVTYLLAIGSHRLQDRGRITIPVFLGDSIQWKQDSTPKLAANFTVDTASDAEMYALGATAPLEGLSEQLQFPEHLLDDPSRFSYLVRTLVRRATERKRGTKPPSIAGALRPFGLSQADAETITDTFTLLCHLHDQGRNHIWGYFVTNLARPLWLSRIGGRVDRLVGNPPWLAYRYMPRSMKQSFRDAMQDHNMWVGGKVATQQELASYFVVRTAELYLKDGGHFGFVLPRAALSRKAWQPFRTAKWTQSIAELGTPWDLKDIQPDIFPVPASVIFGTLHRDTVRSTPKPMPATAHALIGKVDPEHPWAHADVFLKREERPIAATDGERKSPYAARFTNGATIFPRLLFFVEEAPTPKLGLPSGQKLVTSRRTNLEKPPWKDIPSLGPMPVPERFIRPTYLGENVLPFRTLEPLPAVIPATTEQLLNEEAIQGYPNLSAWWDAASDIWESNKTKNSKLNLLEQLDYMRKLDAQLPAPPHRVVYTKSGSTVAAASVSDSHAIIDHKLYWATVPSISEADYLCAILNSPVLTQRVRPMQAQGAFGPRDIDMYIWNLPIPEFNPRNQLHLDLAAAGANARDRAAEVDVEGMGFQKARNEIRDALRDILQQADSLVQVLITATP